MEWPFKRRESAGRTRGIKGVKPAKNADDDRQLRALFGSSAALQPPDATIRTILGRLRAESRYEYRSSDWARRVVQSARNHVVGNEGLMLRVEDAMHRAEVEDAWAYFSEHVESSGRLSRPEVEKAVVSGLYIEGECVFTHLPDGRVTMVDPARLATDAATEREENGRAVYMGVEIDVFTREPLAYWIDRLNYTRSGYALTYGRGRNDATRHEARDVTHVYQSEHAEQTRGLPWLSTAVPRLKALREYEVAELRSAKLASNKVGFIEQSGEGGNIKGEGADADGNTVLDADAGGFVTLDSGAKATVPDWGRPSDQFDNFSRMNLLGVAGGTGAPFSELGGVSEANFSSIRAERLSVQETWTDLQDIVRRQFTIPLFRRWLRVAMLRGEVRAPLTAYRDIIRASSFAARSWPHVQPREAAAADQIHLETGLYSSDELIAASGRDPRAVPPPTGNPQGNSP